MTAITLATPDHRVQWARAEAFAAYGLAALFGLALVLRIFPPAALDGTLTLVRPVTGDPAQHIIGQRYFLADAWRWPPLLTRLIAAPHGVNIALTDSIPLAALAAKLFAGWLPHGGHLVYAWVALCFVLQPLSAVFALRSAGVRGLTVILGASAIAACLPAFIFRFGHAALCAHFTLLLATGLYFRLVAAPWSAWLLAAAALMTASLLVHPYLLAMTAGILFAAPVSLAVQGRFAAAAGLVAGLAAALAAPAAMATVGGYLGADGATGYGYYSLNLLAPFVPAGSALIGGYTMPDATGGQYEGFSYLGLGLMALSLVALAQLRLPAVRAWARRHAGLAVVAAGAAAFAVSDDVYAGHALLFHLPLAPDILRQFRASGRFVWVDLYLLLIGVTVLASLGLGRRWAAGLLVTAALLQFADTRTLRGQVSAQLRRPAAWSVDPAFYRPLLASHRLLTLWPTAACNPEMVGNPVFMHMLLLVSEAALPVNTIPTARTAGPEACDTSDLLRPALQPGELRVLLPGVSPNLVTGLPGLRDRCHTLPGGLLGCSAQDRLAGLPVVRPAVFPLNQHLSLGQPDGAALRGLGWTDASADGAWTIGPVATLLGALPPQPGVLRFTVLAHGLARDGKAQTVTVSAGGRDAGTWQVSQGADRPYEAMIPAGAGADGTLVITLHVADPVPPNEVLGNGDPRPVGLFLRSFQLDAP